MEKTVYLRLRHRVQARQNDSISLADIAQIIAEPDLKEALAKLIVYRINMSDNNFVIIDVMQVVDRIMKYSPALEVQTFGPPQTIVQIELKKKPLKGFYFIGVWLLLFIGSALTIMNFHEDVSMPAVQQRIYKIVTGRSNPKPLIFQIPYSFGIGLGMILFFNHLFKKRINEEPSPLEVEMFHYQQSVDQYMILHENKESMKNLNDH